MSSYATKTEVYDAVVTGVQLATGLIPDTSDMATKTWVGNQGYLTSIPSSYATDIEVSQAIASSVSGFVTEPEVTALIPETKEITFKEVNLSDFALASSVTAIPMSNVITTAGITDIQMVTALPQDPVSSVLYIIPEA